MGFGSIFAGAVSDLFSNILNYNAVQKTNNSNERINQRNLDYNAAMTQKQWERDDTAHQREVADLEAAGLSPLAALGGSPNGSPLDSPSPISMQAPQFDTNALVQSVIQSEQLQETKRHNQASENLRSSEIANEAERIQNEVRSLDIQETKVAGELNHFANLDVLEARRIDEIVRSNKKGEEIKLSEVQSQNLERESKRLAIERQKATGGKNIKTIDVYNVEDLIYYNQRRQQGFQEVIDKIKKLKTNQAIAKGKNDSVGFSFGAGALGVGANGGLNTSEGSNDYMSENNSQLIQTYIDEFNENYPIAVYIDTSKYPHTYYGR